MKHRIRKLDVHLVSTPVTGGFADATRKVETIGYLVVRVTTDSGLEGIGITYHEVGGEATSALINRNMAPRLIGRDPLETDAIWHEFFHYLRGVGRKGLMYCALSAVDIALWDLKGKITGLPLYRLLGGNRTRVPVYASGGWTSYSDEELVAEMKGMVSRGFRTIKFKLGYEGGRNPRRDVQRVRKVREAVGPDIDLLVDANNCFDAATAIQLANNIREYDIMLFEEPVFADDIPGLARFKRGTDIPLGTGEHEYTKFGLRDLLIHDAVDIVQVDGARVGGYTEMLKCAALTEAWNVKFAPHAMENIHLHLVAAVPNGLFLERLLMFEDITAKLFKDAPVPVDGYMHVPDLPGLGLALDMDFIHEHDETSPLSHG
ncbi:mandelate racemase/muconate lactonizing enzyme family protein [Bosea sp. (in: a-proteobacteria)]|uniref:mandelate racemase/muconate lactonizing enzyme family protein n=1 Tax=Bosea sp. (in: a-proteobacteria) TaxID=1871050 RepID=UPI0026206D88|nr:mandelate racemase/muconate lactonizing enzyme family protein [Bosea sp. (in: a-proteobacteria)]MCO5090377.1 mandelate racemase/muconate lactonizing enzyme family protein [Bosea sp. (in: a-proteobacteria)]